MSRLVATFVAAAMLFVLAPAAQAADYVALGDSYASGNGTRSYDYDTSSACKRSKLAHPYLIKGDFGSTFAFPACSGGTTDSVLTSQVQALGIDTKYVTVTVGGNDAGFADVVTQCLLPGDCSDDLATAQSFITTTLPGLLDQVYTQIRTRAPTAAVAVAAYPRIFNGEDCHWFTFFSGSEMTKMNDTANLLATTIKGRAEAHGFAFADVRAAFEDHAVCDNPEWINNLSDPVSDSFHPNAAGQSSGYAPVVKSALKTAVPPATQITGGPDGPTGDATPTFTFTSDDASATYQCRVDTGTWAGCSSPRTTSTLSDGSHTFSVRGIDTAGFKDLTPAQRTFTVDTTAPAAPATTAPASPTTATRPPLAFTGEAGASFECATDSGAYASCTSPYTPAALSDGEHTLKVVAIDAAGNRSAAGTATVTVDTSAPSTTIEGGPEGLTGADDASFAFGADDEDATFACRLDDAGFEACTSPYAVEDLDDGPHAFEVRATDALGNVETSVERREFTVDTTAPGAPGVDGPDAPTTDTTPDFALSSAEDGVTFACSVGDAEPAACTSPYTPAALDDGEHTVKVVAIDAAGNRSAAGTATVTVDTTAPSTSIDGGPDGPVADATPQFTFSSSDASATFACRIDDGDFADCSSPHVTAALDEREHTFEVRARDALGNTETSVERRTFSVDTTAPATTIDSGPEGETDDATPQFTFSAGDPGATFACRIDDADFAACTSPYVAAELADGEHAFEVRATDALGNVETPQRRAFTVDTTPPAVPDPPTGGGGQTANPNPNPPAATGTPAPPQASAQGGAASRSNAIVTGIPKLTAVSLSRRVLKGRTAKAFLRFRLSVAAPLAVQLERRTGKPRRYRYRTARTLKAEGRAGAGRLAIPVRVKGKALAPGTYRLTLTPQGGKPVRLTFRVKA